MNNSSRHYYLGIILILSLILLNACNGGKYVIINGGIQSTNHSMNGTYSKFSGYYYRRIQLKKQSKVYINFYSTTKRGSLTLELIDQNGNVLFKTNKNDQENEQVSINNPGMYKFEVIGKNHKGNFKVVWHIS